VLLGVIVVTAATGGFTLGYFVGKSASSPPVQPVAKQQPGEGESSLPALPVSVAATEPSAGGAPAAVPAGQNLLPETKRPDTAPAAPEQAPVKPVPKQESRTGPSGAPVPPVSEVKTSAEKAPSARTAVSQAAGPDETGVAPSSPKIVYTVQAGAFRNQKDAEALKRKLESKKMKTSIRKEASAKGVVFYKVRTGEFENKKEASVFALKLKKTESLNAFVTTKK
jgi:cell division protein FtsN